MKDSVKDFLHGTKQAVLVTIVLLLLCGFLFPVVLSGLSSVFFPHQAGGSMITVNGQAVGAENVGQEFTQDYYLWSRPSAYHYNVYVEDEDGNQYYNDGTEFPGIGSGLDPHISPESAEIQIPRIVEASGLSEEQIREIIANHTSGKVLGIFGENTVNVLKVNLDIAQAMGLLTVDAE